MSASNVNPDPKPAGTKVITGPVVISYPQLFVAKQVLGQGEAYFGAAFLLDPAQNRADLEAMARACEAAAQIKWPRGEWRAKRELRDGNIFWWPIRNGDEKAERKGYAGKFFVSARTKERPGVVDANMVKVIDPSAVYPGMIVRASLNFFAYSQPKWGIGVGLNNVQLLRDGERLGGRPDPEDDFEPIAFDTATKGSGGGEPSWMA